MQALAITLREGLEIALVLAVLTAYFSKTGQGELNRYAYIGAAIAGALSAAVAVVLSRLGIDPDNAALEGWLYLAAAALVVSMFVWMRRNGRNIASDVSRRAERASGRTSSAAPLVVASIAFFLVAREGVEIALFLLALSLTGASTAPVLVGGLVGLALAGALGVLFVRGAVDLDLGSFFSATSVVLLLFGVMFALKGVGELMEAGVIPEFAAAEKVLEVLAGPVATNVVLALLVAVPLVLVARGLVGGSRARH